MSFNSYSERRLKGIFESGTCTSLIKTLMLKKQILKKNNLPTEILAEITTELLLETEMPSKSDL